MNDKVLLQALINRDLEKIKEALESGANPSNPKIIEVLGKTPLQTVEKIEKEKWKELKEIVDTLHDNKDKIVIKNDGVEVLDFIKYVVIHRLTRVSKDIATIEEIKGLLQKNEFPKIRNTSK